VLSQNAAWYSGSDYETSARELDDANRDKSVSSILLDISSPGGSAFGVAELAEQIRASSKKVYAYVSGEASSAAYWIASATAKIIAHRTAFVGSIGVMLSAIKNEDEIVIVNDDAPAKNIDAETEEGAASLKMHANTLAQFFMEDVAKFRGVSVETVRNEFGRGDIISASRALELKMIDAVGNFKQALKMLQNNGGNKMRQKISAEFVLVDGETVGADIPVQEVTLENIKTMFPEIAAALIEEGKSIATGEMTEVDELAESADMSEDDEAKIVADARSRVLSASAATKKLLAIKAQKSKQRMIAEARERDNPPTFSNASQGGEIAAMIKNRRTK
jgi:ClpP class serine protease